MTLMRASASLWDSNNIDSGIREYFPKLSADISCEVCVVGGGITGLTVAKLLAEQGLDVVLLEADMVGNGATGGTSAHLDPLFDVKLNELIKRFKIDKIKAVHLQCMKAFDLIEKNIKERAIDCGFEKVKAYYIAENKDELNVLRKEDEAALKLGINSNISVNASMPYSCSGVLKFKGHAIFDPLKYLFELSRAAKIKGVRIFQSSKVRNINENIASLDKGSVKAQHIVLATHVPIGVRPSIQSKLVAKRSYIIGARLNSELENALYYDLKSPYHYVRKAVDSKGELLIIGGSDHKTGERIEAPYGSLKKWADQRFDIGEVDYAWSAQFYSSADGLPYIGRESSDSNIWIATGFDGNGLSFGTMAAQLIADYICEKENHLESFLSPSRLELGATGKRLFETGLGMARDFIKDRLEQPESDIDSVKEGEGKILDIGGELVAVHKDLAGNTYIMNPACTHAKCHVRWNNCESSWDCPCHGGRYSATGEVISGPPTEDLKLIDTLVKRKEKGEESSP